MTKENLLIGGSILATVIALEVASRAVTPPALLPLVVLFFLACVVFGVISATRQRKHAYILPNQKTPTLVIFKTQSRNWIIERIIQGTNRDQLVDLCKKEGIQLEDA